MNKTVTDQNNYMRKLCVLDIENKPNKNVGRADCVDKIDEHLFTKRKNKFGLVLPKQWGIGGICRGTKHLFAFTASNRTGSTLLDKIFENITEGNTISSDSWMGY